MIYNNFSDDTGHLFIGHLK